MTLEMLLAKAIVEDRRRELEAKLRHASFDSPSRRAQRSASRRDRPLLARIFGPFSGRRPSGQIVNHVPAPQLDVTATS